MAEFITGILAFPTVIFTVMLGFVLLYWCFVMFGAVDIDFLDSGGDAVEGLLEGGADGVADGILDGAADGVAHGLLDGAADGVADGLLDGAADGVADGVLDGAADGAVDGAIEGAAHAKGELVAASHGGVFELLSLLGLRKAPVTVVGSLLIAWNWLVSFLAMYYLGSLLDGTISHVLLGSAVFVGSFVAALPLTSLSVRPMGRLFETAKATTRGHMLGKICIISTGRVTNKFGQATYEGRGESMLMQVRTDSANKLKKGDQALIINFDEKRGAFIVEALDPVLLDDGLRSQP